jgi:phosphoribosylformimino-5-aminoimidazole carboxamide ribotide isomerase
MLIPSIDLQRGRIVQLVQGETLAVETTDLDAWITRFSGYPKVQLIDLDAAKAEGRNDPLVREICGRLTCRVGGGIRSIDRARDILTMGATHVILSSALFTASGPDLAFAGTLADAIGRERIIAAVDSRGGRVAIHGWRTVLDVTTVEAVRALEPYVDEFLYTHVDLEGLMRGTDLEAVQAVRAATSRRLTAAGGISSHEEVAKLDALGVDAVVGMAIYTGRMNPSPDRPV